MTASRADRMRRAGAAEACMLVAIAVLYAAPAASAASSEWTDHEFRQLAQTEAPLKLAPPERGPDTETDRPGQRPAGSRIDVEELTAPAGRDQPSSPKTGVEVNTLTEVDPDSVGLIDASQGGFGVDLWKNTDRRLVERLLPALPAASRSGLARSMLLRLLLSRATAPEGESSRRNLLKLRVAKLMATGDVKSAVDLMRVSPGEAVDEDFSRAEVESLFFQNDNPSACGKVRTLARRYKGAYWQQAYAFCLALSGQHARSAMIADILREREADIGPAFFNIVDALAGDTDAVVDSLPDPQGLQLSMMRASSLKLPGDVVDSPRPIVLRTVALSPNAELELRLEAAERAMTVGALTVDELIEIYDAVPFVAGQLANPAAAAGEMWGPRGRALLLRDVSRRDDDVGRAEALRRAWGVAREKGGFRLLINASAPLLTAIEPAAELMWFAKDAGWALFAAGRTQRALAWYSLANQESANDEARTAARALWPLAQLALPDDASAWNSEALDGWWRAVQAEPGDAGRTKAAMLFTVLESLDRPVGAERWARLVGVGQPAAAVATDVALWHALRLASEGSRLGETVLLSLLALGVDGADGASPMTVGVVIRALRRVGLKDEARTLALEAAIAAGI